MQWNPYTDCKNRGFSHILTTLFPEQTKNLPRILLWGLIFLIDLTLAAFAVYRLGLLEQCRDQNGMVLACGLLFLAVVGVFWLQGWIWGALMGLFRRIKG